MRRTGNSSIRRMSIFDEGKNEDKFSTREGTLTTVLSNLRGSQNMCRSLSHDRRVAHIKVSCWTGLLVQAPA